MTSILAIDPGPAVPRVISFFAPGTPKGQPRPRAFARRMADGRSIARMYDDGTAENWKSQIALASKPHFAGQSSILGPVSLRVLFYFARPKLHFRSNGDLKPNAPRLHTTKPDADNCIKAVKDALTQLGVWRDDCLVAVLHVEKLYVVSLSSPSGAFIHISEL